MAVHLLLFILIGLITSVFSVSGDVLKLGALFPVYKTSSTNYAFDSGGHNRLSGFYVAVQEINNRTDGVLDDLHPNLTIQFSFHDSKRNEGQAFFGAADAVSSDFGEGVHAIVGAASSGPSASVATVAAQALVPQISYSSSSPGLSNKVYYPYFLRTTGADDFQATAMADVFISYFGWTNIVIISALDTYSSYGAAALEEQCVLQGISVQATLSIATEWDTDEIEYHLKDIMDSGFKVIVMFIDATVGYDVMIAAQRLKMTGTDSGYMWILSDAMATSNVDNLEELLGDELTGFLLFSPQLPSGDAYEAYVERYRRQPSTLGSCLVGQNITDCNCSNVTDAMGNPLFMLDHDEDDGAATPARCTGWDFASDPINTYNPMAYDAVVVLATVASEMLYEEGAIEGGPSLLGRLLNFSARTEAAAAAAGLVSGALAFDENGDRSAGLGFSIANYHGANRTAKVVATWTVEDGLVLSTTDSFQYPNSNNSVPVDFAAPVCEVGEVLPTGSLACIACVEGHFSWMPGEESCHECPSGAGCSGGAILRGQFGYWRFPNSTGYCPDGGYDGCSLYQCAVEEACEGDHSVSNSASLSLGSDMLYFSEPINAYTKSLVNYFCQEYNGTYKSSCIFNLAGQLLHLDSGTANAVSSTSLKLATVHSDHIVGDIFNAELVLMLTERCATGYTGNACNKCDAEANYQKDYRGRCVKCHEHGLVVWLLFFLTVCVLLAAGLTAVKMKLNQSVRSTQRSSIILKILMSWGQMMAVFASFGIDWPRAVLLLFSTQDAVLNSGSNLISLDCVLNDIGLALNDQDGGVLLRPMVVLLFWMSVPVLIIVISHVFWSLLSFLKARQFSKQKWDLEFYSNRGMSQEAQDQLIEAHEVKSVLFCLGEDCKEIRVAEVIRLLGLESGGVSLEDFQKKYIEASKSINRSNSILTIVVMLFVLYPALVKKTFTLFTCVPMIADAMYLEIDLDFQCFTQRHTLWICFLGIPALALYVIGIPLVAMNTLRRHKKDLDELHFKCRFNFLYDGYRREFFWWEGVVLLRKVAIITVSVVANQLGSTAFGVTGLVVVLTFVMLQSWARPFIARDLNALEQVSLHATLVTYVCGLYFLEENLSPAFKVVLVVVIYVANAYFIFMAARLLRTEVEIAYLKTRNSVLGEWGKLSARIDGHEEKLKEIRQQTSLELQRQDRLFYAEQNSALLGAQAAAAALERDLWRARASIARLKAEQAAEAKFHRKQTKCMARHFDTLLTPKASKFITPGRSKRSSKTAPSPAPAARNGRGSFQTFYDERQSSFVGLADLPSNGSSRELDGPEAILKFYDMVWQRDSSVHKPVMGEDT